jgi:hypothetical protein
MVRAMGSDVQVSMSRRHVLRAAAATPALALVGGIAGARPIAAGRTIFLYDAAAPLASFYATIGGGSVEAVALQGDISEVWHRLDRRLAAKPFALAGVTTHDHYFCMQILASGRRLRPVARGRAPLSIGAAGTALLAPEPELAPARDGDRHIFWSFAPITHDA